VVRPRTSLAGNVAVPRQGATRNICGVDDAGMRAVRERRYLVQVLSLLGLVLGLHVLRHIVIISCVPSGSSGALRLGNAAHFDESQALPGVHRQPLALQSAP